MKNQWKKLALRKETVRDLEAATLRGVVGGISGTRICHTINDNCTYDGGCNLTNVGATCASEQKICATGVVSHCNC